MIDKKEAINRLKKICSKKEKCLSEIKNKLKEWQINDEDASEIIEILLQENYINEERYVNAFVNDKIKFDKWGKKKIVHELRMKGINETLINKAINDIDEEEYYKILKNLIEKKKKLIGDSSFETRQKLIRFLISKGYDFDDIKKFIDIENFD